MAISKSNLQGQVRPKQRRRLDYATVGGLAVALAGILGGLLLEGGKIQDVAQITAAMIVGGGTLGAVMVTTPWRVLRSAASRLSAVLTEYETDPAEVIEEIVGHANKARKSGIVSLEDEAEMIRDDFLRKALNLAIDGADLERLQKTMELEIALEEQRGEADAKVYDAAGGYAPTIGIIGAVLGLIQVMKHLDDLNEVGSGIAVAFVATVYGVGLANLLLLPAGAKIRSRLQHSVRLKELMLEGVVGIVEGVNPMLMRLKLAAYVTAQPAAPRQPAQREAGPVPEPAEV